MDRDSSSSSSDFTSSSVDDGAEDPLGTPHLPFLSPNRVVADGCSVPLITVALRWREGRSTGHPPADGGAARAKPALRILRRQHCPTSPSQSSTPLAAAMTMSNLEDNCTQVSGLGMVVPHPEFLPATDAAIEFAVFSPNISVEGLFGGGGERKSAPLVGSEAYLLANLSRTITAELLQVDVLATCSSEAVPPSESSRSSLCEGGSGCQSAEVVTFGLGPQGCGKSTMLLGSVAAPLPCCADGRATAQYECTDLYTKVLQKVFKFGKRVGQRGVQVALSVVELRDAAPFRDPKMCHRPVKAIDLLTLMPATMLAQDIPGRVGNEPATASQSRYDLMSDPADIPAARYVSVSNVVEAVNVLYEALSSSICWKPRRRESSRAHHCDDAGGVDWPPLQPYGAPHEEKQGHLLITVLVGRSLSKGTKDHGTPGLSSTLGIWKLWDLAGPSVWTGYRPAPRIVPGQTMSLPLASSYSLPSLTHSCLTRLATSLLPSHESDVSHVIHETEALVQLDVASSLIASSIAFTASLVCVVTTTVADAALDELNREVLGAAAGWQDLGARAAQRSSFSTTRPECRVARRDENAMAGWRILDHYAIDATLFFSEAERSHQTCNLRSYNDAVVAGSSRSHEGKWQNSRSASESSVPAASKELQRWPKEQVQFVKDHRTPTSPVSRTETVPDLLPQGCPDSAPASFFHAPATADRVAEPLSINVTTVEEFGDCSGFSDALRLLATTQMNPARGDSWQRTTPDADSGDTLTDICKEELSKPPACDGPARRSPENETSVKFQANFLHDLRSNTFSEGLTESHQDPCREATIRTLTAGPVITASLAGDGTPPTAARSPPSVVQTGRRDMVYTASVHDSGDFGEVTDVTIELFGGAAGPLATPECRAAHEILPAGLNKDRATRPKDTPVISGPNGSMSQLHPSAPASLASALQPTLDRFRRICVEMTESMAAWKSEESATLCRLATLVESQEEELKCLSSVTLAQVAGRKIEADDLPQFKRESLQPLPDTSAVMEELIRISRDRSPTGSSLAVASSTNSLLYEQLLKSNEKIVWLEGQVILWRRRAREAVSSLPPASVPESMLISDGSGLLSEDVQPAIFSSPSPSEDPLQPYLASAINALRYLLKRCDAMYRRAQQGSARLQGHILAEQQTREQLMDRVVELEQELAQYRQRSCQVARNTKSLNTARARDSSLDSLGQTPLRGVDAPSLSRSRTPIRRETDIDSRRTLISSSPNTANRSPLSHHPGHRAATIGPWTPPLRASSPATRYRCTEWSPEAAGVATTTTTAVPTEVGGAELLMSRGVTPLPRPAPGGLASQSTSAPMPGIVERVVPPDPAQGTGNLSRPPTMAALPFNTTNPRLRRPAALKSRPRPTVVNSSDRLSTRSSASSPNAAVAAEELSNLLLRAVTCGTDRDASGSPVPSADGCCDVGRDATAERRVRPFDVRVRRSTSTESFTGFMSTPPCGSVGEKKMSGALLQSPATMRHPLTSASYATGDLHDRQYHNIELLGEARHCIDSTVTLEPKDGLGSIVEPKDAKVSLALVRSGVVELTDYPSPSMAALKSAVGEVEESAIASLQLHIPTRAGETEYSLDASFYNAVSHLRAASRALQADTRQAAEREVEYLTALLSTPPTCEVRGRL